MESRESKPRKALSGKGNHPRGKMWRKREAYAEVSSVIEAGGHDDSSERNKELKTLETSYIQLLMRKTCSTQ